MLTILPVAWADFFGRESYGAIRGVALSIQVLAQASGPLISGILHDLTGNYTMSLYFFVGMAVAAFVAALFLRQPK
jgi:cyanate permease